MTQAEEREFMALADSAWSVANEIYREELFRLRYSVERMAFEASVEHRRADRWFRIATALMVAWAAAMAAILALVG